MLQIILKLGTYILKWPDGHCAKFIKKLTSVGWRHGLAENCVPAICPYLLMNISENNPYSRKRQPQKLWEHLKIVQFRLNLRQKFGRSSCVKLHTNLVVKFSRKWNFVPKIFKLSAVSLYFKCSYLDTRLPQCSNVHFMFEVPIPFSLLTFLSFVLRYGFHYSFLHFTI